MRTITRVLMLLLVSAVLLTTITSEQAVAADKKAASGRKIAHVRLSGKVSNAPEGMELFSFGSSSVTLRDWIRRLAVIRKDKQIHAVAIELGSPGVSWAHAQELSGAIQRLAKVKPVHVYLTSANTSGYLLASAGKTLSMEPVGQIMITGLAAELTFFRGTLDWLGVEPQFIQIGRFKGAAEPYARTGPSKELTGEYDKILDDLYDQLVSQVASQRKLTPQAVRSAVDEGPFSAALAKKLKLIDRMESRVAWQERLIEQYKNEGLAAEWKKDFGKKKKKTPDFSNPFALIRILMEGSKTEKIHAPTIAIIHADGMIMSGKSGESLFGAKTVGSATLVKCFDKAAADDRIKAVVFRIDSPGGSALASELIYQAVKRCAAKKPVIASIAQTGASGGYYIALGAKTIIGDAAGITGSIGVISGKMAVKKAMGKLGIATHAITRGKNAGVMLSRPWNEREKALMRKMAQDIYDVFTKRVKDSRGKRIGDVETVAQGRIFTARQAKKNGLIDEVGGLREAVALAKKEAKLDSCYFITLPKPATLMSMLSGDTGASSLATPPSMAALERIIAGQPGAYLLTLADLLSRERILMALPHHMSIKH
ncbi:MAG: signal peptide peptidase SppA [bacterium]|nr:signal peptide peptidase SppA [bacterium]